MDIIHRSMEELNADFWAKQKNEKPTTKFNLKQFVMIWKRVIRYVGRFLTHDDASLKATGMKWQACITEDKSFLIYFGWLM